MGDIKRLLDEIDKAKPAYEKAQKYSDGEVNEVWGSERVAAHMNKTAGKYMVNIARRPIDAVLDKLEITEVSVADDPKLTDELKVSIWDDNELDLELPDALDKAETFGDAYLVCWPRPDTDGNETDVFVNDPLGMRMIYDPENPRVKLYAGRTWINEDGYRRVTLWRAGPRVERWVSRSKAADNDSSKDEDFQEFQADEDPESWFEDLGLGLGVPVFHLRTKRPYGVPEHKAAYGTQNMLTKDIATMMDATDGYGLPFRYALTKSGGVGMLGSTTDDWGTDGDDTPTAPKAPKAEPGTLAKMMDTDAVGQLQPADVGNFLDPIGMTLRLSSVVTNTPLSYFDPSAASASGDSKKEHEKPAVKKANRRLRSYGATVKDTLEYSLALRGHQDVKVMITWAPTESVDDAAEVKLAQDRQDAGVPKLTTLTELGYPKEEVERWIEEATNDDEILAARVALFAQLATAAKDFGTAASLGAVSMEFVKAFIEQTMTKPTGDGQ